jgi:acid phosphatase (class A)
MRKMISLLAALCLMGSGIALAEDAKPFADNKEIDLLAILPPPPARFSPSR